MQNKKHMIFENELFNRYSEHIINYICSCSLAQGVSTAEWISVHTSVKNYILITIHYQCWEVTSYMSPIYVI